MSSPAERVVLEYVPDNRFPEDNFEEGELRANKRFCTRDSNDNGIMFLQKENEALRNQIKQMIVYPHGFSINDNNQLAIKISETFTLRLYKSQWLRLIENTDTIRNLITC